MTAPTRRPRRSLLRKTTGPTPAGVGPDAPVDHPGGDETPGYDAHGYNVLGDDGPDGDDPGDAVQDDTTEASDVAVADPAVPDAVADVELPSEPASELAAAFSPAPTGPRPTLVPAPHVDTGVRAPGRSQAAAASVASSNLMWPVLFGLGLLVIGIAVVLMLGLGGILFSDAKIGSTPGVATAGHTTQE